MAERFARQSATSGRSPERQTNPALARPGPEYAGILHVKEGRTGRKMNRIVSTTSTLLVVAGLVILAYVGISYARSLPPSAHHWSAGQEARGKRLAASLVHHQRVAIPKSLQGTRSSVGSEPATWMTIPKIDLSAPVVQAASPTIRQASSAGAATRRLPRGTSRLIIPKPYSQCRLTHVTYPASRL